MLQSLFEGTLSTKASVKWLVILICFFQWIKMNVLTFRVTAAGFLLMSNFLLGFDILLFVS
jgi:hypothetical protein